MNGQQYHCLLFQIAVEAIVPDVKGIGDCQKPVFIWHSFFSLLLADKGETKLDSAGCRNIRIDRLS